MRTDAQVDHGPTAVYRGGRAVGYFGLNDVLLIFVVLAKRMSMMSEC